MVKDENGSQEEGRASRIKEAAKQLFIERGYDGTTMQAIADASKVNKALLHYYFQSKDKLFLQVFREELAELAASMSALWQEGVTPIRQRFEKWIDDQTALMARSPRLHLFTITEMTRNPKLIKELLVEFLPPPHVIPASALDPGAKDRPKLPVIAEVAAAAYSLIFFPVVAAPMVLHLLGINSSLLDENIVNQTQLAKDLVRRRFGEDAQLSR